MGTKSIIQLYSNEPLKYSTSYPDIEPTKTLDDVVFHLSLAARIGDRPQDNFQSMNAFTTGVTFQCPFDRVLMITSSEALLRQGYMVPGVVLVQPKNNHEEVKVDIFKFSDKDDIVTPFHKALKVTVVAACYHHLKKNPKGHVQFLETPVRNESSLESNFF